MKIYMIYQALVYFGLIDKLFADQRCPYLSSRYIDDALSTDQNGVQSMQCAIPPEKCVPSKYRSLDGSCNNLNEPGWGMARTRYARLIKPNYSDGFASPPISVTGDALPSARLTSNRCFLEVSANDNNYTLLNMQWGQMVAHDMSLIAGSILSIRNGIQCCTSDGKMMDINQLDPKCFPIEVPKNDSYGAQYDIECQNFVRTTTDKDVNCSDGEDYAEQLSIVTPFIDLSSIYGENEAWCSRLRSFEGGRLRVDRRNNKEWPPAALDNYDTCDISHPDEICYYGGDVRVNQNTGLTVLTIVMVREHNRLADGLRKINSHWTDERIFHEARRINIAENQHITYYEWMPILLGKANLTRYGVIYENTHGCYVNDYNCTVNPAVLNEHANAAFRYYHSQIQGELQLMQPDISFNQTLRLSNYYYKPNVIEKKHNFKQLLNGMVYQAQQETDRNYNQEIRDYWLRMGRKVGDDLRAIDIQRNRDHGLRSFNDYRVWSGKPKATKWEDYGDTITAENLNYLKGVYASHEDVDLTVGGSSEDHSPDTLAGPLLNKIMVEQFYRTRVSDRFFYENGQDINTRFTMKQLTQIRKASASRILCDNSDIGFIQRSGFKVISKKNPLVRCSSLPRVDLRAWKETLTSNNNF